MGKLEGKVALITGGARGQGRSHAVRLAEEGADIIATDLCAQMATVEYPMSTPEDLEETARLVKETGRRIVTRQADVRDADAMVAAVVEGVKELGRLDLVSANAGIMPFIGDAGKSRQAWIDGIDVMLSGVYYTIEAALPALLEGDNGGSIAITSSTAGFKGPIRGLEGNIAGWMSYTAAKHGVIGVMRMYANALAPHNIRVNTVHPSAVRTPMILNKEFEDWAPQAVPWMADVMGNALPVESIEPVDVSNALVWLFSDDARYVTGATLPVDAGWSIL